MVYNYLDTHTHTMAKDNKILIHIIVIIIRIIMNSRGRDSTESIRGNQTVLWAEVLYSRAPQWRPTLACALRRLFPGQQWAESRASVSEVCMKSCGPKPIVHLRNRNTDGVTLIHTRPQIHTGLEVCCHFKD